MTSALLCADTSNAFRSTFGHLPKRSYFNVIISSTFDLLDPDTEQKDVRFWSSPSVVPLRRLVSILLALVVLSFGRYERRVQSEGLLQSGVEVGAVVDVKLEAVHRHVEPGLCLGVWRQESKLTWTSFFFSRRRLIFKWEVKRFVLQYHIIYI